MKVADYIIYFLAGRGVKHIFMLPGGGVMHLTDALARQKRIKFVACLHEQGAAIAADGYAQYANTLGVCMVTTGPGATNAITGVYGSWVESTPVLVISGQVKTKDIKESPEMRMLGFQEVDIVSMVQHITKYAVTVKDAHSIRYHLEAALYHAKTGRPGPVWLDIPLDVQATEIDPLELGTFPMPPPPPKRDVAQAARQVAGLLRASERPVLLLGNGVRMGGAVGWVREHLKPLGIPTLLTYKAADLLPADNVVNVGRPGTIALRGANFALQSADLVIAIGARLDPGTVGYDRASFAPGAKKVVVDIDGLELWKHAKEDCLRVCADAGDFLPALRAALDGKDMVRELILKEWYEAIFEWHDAYPAVTLAMRKQKDYVSTYVLLDELSTQMQPDDLLVPGSSGACSEVSLQTFRVKAGQRVLNSPSIGAMGFGVPQAIGACIASGRRTVCVNGDGGFQLNAQELEVVRRLNLPIKFFVLNNGGYGSMRHTSRNYFRGRKVASDESSGLTLPSAAKLAAAYGIECMSLTFNKNVQRQVAAALGHPSPVIVEVMVNPNETPQPRVRSEVQPDGSMKSKPMHDMWPYLSRKELAANTRWIHR